MPVAKSRYTLRLGVGEEFDAEVVPQEKGFDVIIRSSDHEVVIEDRSGRWRHIGPRLREVAEQLERLSSEEPPHGWKGQSLLHEDDLP